MEDRNGCVARLWPVFAIRCRLPAAPRSKDLRERSQDMRELDTG